MPGTLSVEGLLGELVGRAEMTAFRQT